MIACSTIRRATVADINLIQEAMAAMPFDVQAASLSEIAEGIESGQTAIYMLESESALTLVGVQRDKGSYAQFGGLYRVGGPEGLVRDCRTLMAYIIPILVKDGCRDIGLMVQLNNPLHKKLLSLYNRLGFRSSAIAMTAQIGAL